MPDNTGTTAIGTSTTVSTTTIGENAVRTFTGDGRPEGDVDGVGQHVLRGVDLTVRDPNGIVVASLFVIGADAVP